MRDPPIEVHRAVGAGQVTAPGAGPKSILLLGLPGVGDPHGSAFPEVEFSESAVSLSVKRGEKLAREKGHSLI